MNRILVVDDTKMILELAKNIIEHKIEDSKVVVETDPIVAKEKLLDDNFNLLILDIVMPKISGIELLEWIKKQKVLSELKVIMFTSVNDKEALLKCFELGAYDFISKPLEANEFLARIKHAIVEYNQEEIIKNNLSELKKKNETLENMYKKLKFSQAELIQSERLASVGFLAAGMAHEINNPLGYINSNIVTLKHNYAIANELISELKSCCKTKDEKLFKYIVEKEYELGYTQIQEDMDDIFEDLKNGITQIARIITSLRDFSQVDSGANLEFVKLEDIFFNIKELTNMKFKEKAEVKIDVIEDAELLCNKGDVHLAFMNIVINAYEAILKKGDQKKGKIEITVDALDDEYNISILDDGVGMEEDLKNRIFDPFFTTKDVGAGAGLGLTTAYNCIVKGLGGTIKVVSGKNTGTEFKITLPK